MTKTNSLTAIESTAQVPALNPLLRWPTALFTRARKASADRALRRQLAEMDSTLLRDIGIADDEIHRIRGMDHFTPRKWA
jgi:uncharacterized protein YjiS (DUF1127 family)